MMNDHQNGECSQKKCPTNYNYFHSFLAQNHGEEFFLSQSEQCEKLTDHLIYFDCLFSVKETALSIQKKNQNLYQINFDQSDSEPDDIYLRRKTKVNKLKKKEQSQLQQLENLKGSSFPKYQAIVRYMKFLCDTKKKINGARTDYYSAKTFCALINSSESQICMLITILKRMFSNILKFPQKYIYEGESSSTQNQVDIRILEFLIIPRFLISKQKIMRLIKDENLQKNFQFLIENMCLGHYNNQANKKMPQNDRVEYIRQLLKKSKGREKFKKICSINHGNKFLKNYNRQYFQLYSRSYDYLNFLDNQLRRGKKFTQLKEQLQKIPTRETEETQNSQSQSLSSSSNRISFRSLRQQFNQMNISDGASEEIGSIPSLNMSKLSEKCIKIRQEDEQKKPNIVFKVRKSLTTNSQKMANIILIQPPNQA